MSFMALERMEKEPTYKKEMIRWAKAHVESAQVEANRQFFDEFDAIVENDAIEAYKFLRDHTKKITDPDDVYLEKQREESRKSKGLPPTVAILPDRLRDDEKRNEEEQAEKKQRAAKQASKDNKEAYTETREPTAMVDCLFTTRRHANAQEGHHQ